MHAFKSTHVHEPVCARVMPAQVHVGVRAHLCLYNSVK